MTYTTIAETQNYIVLDEYTKLSKVSEAPATYQSENALERELIDDPRGTRGRCPYPSAKPQPSGLYRRGMETLL